MTAQTLDSGIRSAVTDQVSLIDSISARISSPKLKEEIFALRATAITVSAHTEMFFRGALGLQNQQLDSRSLQCALGRCNPKLLERLADHLMVDSDLSAAIKAGDTNNQRWIDALKEIAEKLISIKTLKSFLQVGGIFVQYLPLAAGIVNAYKLMEEYVSKLFKAEQKLTQYSAMLIGGGAPSIMDSTEVAARTTDIALEFRRKARDEEKEEEKRDGEQVLQAREGALRGELQKINEKLKELSRQITDIFRELLSSDSTWADAILMRQLQSEEMDTERLRRQVSSELQTVNGKLALS